MSNTDEMLPQSPPPELLTSQAEAKKEEPKPATSHSASTETVVKSAPANRQGDKEPVPYVEPVILEGDNVKVIEPEKPKDVEASQTPVEEKENAFSLGVLPWLGILFLVLLVLWLFSMSSPFFANALTLHGWRFWVSIACGALPIVFVAGLALYAYSQFRSLSSIEQFQKSAYSPADLKQKLLVYLQSLPDDYVKKNEFSGTNAKSLTDCLNRLRSKTEPYSDSNGWLQDFDVFRKMQEERAGKIVRDACLLVGIKTAASPWKIVDMLAMAYNSTLMVVRLANLYNRKLSNRDAFRLVCRWSIGIYLSGELGNFAENTSEWITEGISAAYKPLTQILGKAAEGGTNALLVWRLGKVACNKFRPLTE